MDWAIEGGESGALVVSCSSPERVRTARYAFASRCRHAGGGGRPEKSPSLLLSHHVLRCCT